MLRSGFTQGLTLVNELWNSNSDPVVAKAWATSHAAFSGVSLHVYPGFPKLYLSSIRLRFSVLFFLAQLTPKRISTNHFLHVKSFSNFKPVPGLKKKKKFSSLADKVLHDLNLALLQVWPFNPALWYLMMQATTSSFASFTLLGCFHLSGMFSPNPSTVSDYIRVQLGLSLPLGRLPYTPDWAKCPPWVPRATAPSVRTEC